MRLLVATPLYPPESGGPATYAKALAEGLPGRGIDVTVVKFSEVRQQPKLLRHLAYFWRIFQASKEADLILALDPVSVGLPACLAALLRRRPFVVKIVGDYAWEQGRQRFGIWQALDDFVQTDNAPVPVLVLRGIQTFVAGRARRVLVPSEYLKRIVTLWGISAEKITVIANAIPHEELGTVPEALASLVGPRIVTVGRLVPWKGMHGVIAAMQTIQTEIPHAQLIIVGDGPDRASLERYAALRLKQGYTFTGVLSHADTLAVIQSGDVFVLNSSYEGLSHLLLEALTLGKAIVATKAGGNAEVIEQGVNGILVSVGDPQAVSEAISSVLKDTTGRKQLEAQALQSSKRYAPEVMLSATAEFLTSLV